MQSLATFEPCDLGLPGKFLEFRKEQLEAIETVLNGSTRFYGLAIPTGGGKSLTAVGIAKAMGLRTVVLTATKGLQEQYNGDFETIGMVDVRGRSNYACLHDRSASCYFGPLEGCRREARCTARIAGQNARKAHLVTTNYSYWVAAKGLNRKKTTRTYLDQFQYEVEEEEVGRPVELLVCDEGHRAMEELSKCLRVEIKEKILTELKYGHQRTDDIRYWLDWAQNNSSTVTVERTVAVGDYQRKKDKKTKDHAVKLIQLEEAVDKLLQMNSNDWVVEMIEGTKHGRIWQFDCIWPGNWAEGSLFLGVPKVVLMSATLRPASMRLLGVKPENYTFREWPRIFPPQNCPVFHYSPQPAVRMNHKITEEGLKHWVDRIDEIIKSRKGTKGIIHTVSYARQQYLQAHSKHAGLFLCNTNQPDSESAGDVVRAFKTASPPSILVSPSFSTGWDFPDDECRWQIITKVPYPDARSKVMQARVERSPQYVNSLTMQDLVQSCGRPMRHHKDWCETFIVDDNIGWFLIQNKSLAPTGFEIVRVSQLPKQLTIAA